MQWSHDSVEDETDVILTKIQFRCFKMLALACSHKAVKCSQAKCSADLATWVYPVVECQTQLGVPIDLCCFSFYEFVFPLHHSVNPALQTKHQPAYQWWSWARKKIETEFVSSKIKIPVLVVVLELRYQMEDLKCLSNRKYPTKDIMAPPCTAKSCTLSTKPQCIIHDSENMDNNTISAEQNHWAV